MKIIKKRVKAQLALAAFLSDKTVDVYHTNNCFGATP